MKVNSQYKLVIVLAAIWVFTACSPAGGDFPGREYMPDMAHSIAYEANYYNYYSFNTWGTEEEYKQFAMPRLPVKGTIPRTSSKTLPGVGNGSAQYYYGDTEEERTRASQEIIENPFPITDAGLARGKNLYAINCGICHGEKGDGAGYLVRDDGGVYPAQPANFLQGDLLTASNGQYYHAVVYGKNVMGGYTDKLSYEERWQVIHYVRSLQAKELGLAYNENENTLNSIEIPAATMVSHETHDVEVEEGSESTDHHNSSEGHDESHGHDHDHDHGHGDSH